jgi:hypothetical protein
MLKRRVSPLTEDGIIARLTAGMQTGHVFSAPSQDWNPPMNEPFDIVGDEQDHEFIFTKSRNREQCRSAWTNPLPHTPMDRWVKCFLIEGKIVLGELVENRQKDE